MPLPTLLRLWPSLEACPWNSTLAAEWQELFPDDFERLVPHLKPTGALATSYPCPCPSGDHCPRNVFERDGGLVAVCGNLPTECEPVKLTKTALAVLRLDHRAVLAPLVEALCAREVLSPVALEAPDGILPLGLLVRRAGTALVVLATPEGTRRHGALVEARHAAQAGAVVVLVADDRPAVRTAEGLVELPVTSDGLGLWRAVKLLWPEAWAGRAKDAAAVFEDVVIELGSEPGDAHLVSLNGVALKDFKHGDQAFARLLLLAAARVKDDDVEDGGWVPRRKLQPEDNNDDLLQLRDGLHRFVNKKANLKDDTTFAGLSPEERRALIATSDARGGSVRLAVHPRNVRLSPSLARLELLALRAVEPKKPAKGGKPTKGQLELAKNLAQARARTLKMLEAARELGAPLPDEATLTNRSTDP